LTPVYILDAFTDRLFTGNPAAVVLFDRYPADAILQAIAAENSLAETAFLEPRGEDWTLRWFTPTVEVPLCGHGTLASAWLILKRLHPQLERVTFHTREAGPLKVQRTDRGLSMDFPADVSAAFAIDLTHCIDQPIIEVRRSERYYMAVLASVQSVRDARPDFAAIAALDRGALFVTAPGEGDFDCVSRCFVPAHGIPEDSVTGGAHCMLAPYWSARLGKADIHAYQDSKRGGSLRCRVMGERVALEGECTFYMTGIIEQDFA
jgi:PhzF family phenazine biosynthesis protein